MRRGLSLVPVLRYAGALASVLFLVSVATNTLAPVMARTAASAPLAYGLGGGSGGGGDGGEPEIPPAPMAIAPQSPLAESGPAAPQDSAAPTAEAFAKVAPPQTAGTSPERQQVVSPIPMVWMLTFAVLALLMVGLSFYVDTLTRRKIPQSLPRKMICIEIGRTAALGALPSLYRAPRIPRTLMPLRDRNA